MEQLDYNLLFRWFVGLSPDDRVWDATSFTKNRERLQQGKVFDRFMVKLLEQPKVKPLLSDDHFSVDGTLIEAWASHKSFKPKDSDKDDDGSNFHGQKRKNDTHVSTSDPDAKLYRKAAGREARLSYMGHVVMENRHGLAVAGKVSQADGTAERRASESKPCRRGDLAGQRDRPISSPPWSAIVILDGRRFSAASHRITEASLARQFRRPAAALSAHTRGRPLRRPVHSNPGEASHLRHRPSLFEARRARCLSRRGSPGVGRVGRQGVDVRPWHCDRAAGEAASGRPAGARPFGPSLTYVSASPPPLRTRSARAISGSAG